MGKINWGRYYWHYVTFETFTNLEIKYEIFINSIPFPHQTPGQAHLWVLHHFIFNDYKVNIYFENMQFFIFLIGQTIKMLSIFGLIDIKNHRRISQ